MRNACSATSPSSRLGTNSAPIRSASSTLAPTSRPAPPSDSHGRRCAARRTRAYPRCAEAMTRPSSSSIFPRTNIATAAGTNVAENNNAPRSAATTVNAIGWNIFPSMPVNGAKSGTLTSATTITLTRLGVNTSRVARNTTSNRSSCSSRRPPPSRCAAPSRRRQFSTITTAPSTIKPKSSAPRLIRFPLTPFSTIPVTVKSIDSGMTSAAISAARKFFRNTNRTTITSIAPIDEIFGDRRDGAIITDTVRSYTAFALIPGDIDSLICATLAATRWDTVRLFSPVSMNAVPSTTSSPFSWLHRFAVPCRR